MTTKIRLFLSAEFGTVRTMEEDGRVLFCAKDVAKALGYADAAKAIKLHCKKDGGAIRPLIDKLGRTQNAKFIGEGDVYRLIVKSELPSAARFEVWIFDEVLPAIRKTGMYAADSLLDNPELALEAFTALQSERQKRLAAEQQLADCLPKVQYAEAVTASKSTILVGDLAKLLRQNGVDIGQNRLFEYLRQNGYLMRSGSRRNWPTQRSMDMGLFCVNQSAILSSRGVRLSHTPKVTAKGQQYFMAHFQRFIS